MQTIKPCLWFNNNAEEALDYYKNIFRDIKILDTSSLPNESGEDTLLVATIRIKDSDIMLLNGNANFQFNESISLVYTCENQEEVDYLWSKLTADGGTEVQCGWLKDKMGVSWQIVPKQLGEILSRDDHERVQKAMQAMMLMVKIDINKIEEAYNS